MSVDVAVVAMLVLKFADVLCRCFGIETTLFFGDAMKGQIYVFCHLRSVTADIDTGSVPKPPPEGRRQFNHFVLNIDLVSLVARER